MNSKLKIAMVSALGAAVAAVALAGCHALSRGPAAGAEAANAAPAALSAAGGVEAVKVHTGIAQELVEQAMPHSSPVGQAQLSAAGLEHQAVLASADQTQDSLTELNELFAKRGEELAAVQAKLEDQLQRYARLEGQWYVVWGLRLERAFWTAAACYLAGSIVSVLLGLGSPLSWIGRLRGLISGARQQWIGNALAPVGK